MFVKLPFYFAFQFMKLIDVVSEHAVKEIKCREEQNAIKEIQSKQTSFI